MSELRTLPVTTLGGEASTFDALTGGRVALVVNVASRCGLTPQYAGLEDLHREFADRGFTVIGFPCDQFGGQEPGSAEEIQEFCSATYGVTFPMSGKVDVNGPDRDPVYGELTAAALPSAEAGLITATPDATDAAGDIQWNFEKFLVAADGSVLGRFRPRTEPDDPALRAAIVAALDR